MAVPPASRVVLLFRLFYPLLLLLLLSSLLLGAEAIFRNPRAGALRSSKRPSAFGGRGRNITRPPLPRSFKIYSYPQPLDHFNFGPDDYDTFRQKFVMNREYWAGPNSTSPILVYLGSEGALDPRDAGFVIDLCQNLSSLCVFIEHRFYGASSPFTSMDDVLENKTIRGFFNPAQALADYVEIILYVKRVFNAPHLPVAVFGSSYGGLLAAWFRLKYPHITAMAVASSAPMYYFAKTTDPHAYDEVITEDFRNVSDHCYQTIRNSWAVIDKVASEPDGLANLTQKFKTCAQLNESSQLKGFLVSMYSYAAQYDDPPNPPVDLICKGIDDASKETDDVLDQVSEGMVSYFGNLTCYDMKHFDAPSEINDGWSWQECSELMMHIGQGGNGSLFQGNQPYQLGRQKRRCMNMFNVSSRPYLITTQYGGRILEFALKRFGSNIVFTNGLKDPYSPAGVLEDINESIVAITTEKGSHALDMVTPTASDPDWLVEQRKKVVQKLQTWLSQYYTDLGEYLKNK
ncbi:Serine carboxypeptidase S28 family protein [Striga hermonthica]|uniref:Serine carboxypeptidase S28 family protein n=1 Tax=Striga hermonthica TaxID=68872 RepID=A0A9N7R4V7_STRHE|nr:Serine carboxypeptidase S28 family protein [Striga hermonthica]